VSVSPQRGVLVKELSAREVSELFDVRLAIEPYAVSMLATRSLSRDEQQLLKDSLAQQRAAAKAEDVIESTHLDIKFHRTLVELLDHQEFMLWFERIFDKLHRSIVRINRLVPGRLMKSYHDHRAIVNAILKPQQNDPAATMRDHLAYGRQFLLSR
jgi:DNA-binding GntR family transcriptional regulator